MTSLGVEVLELLRDGGPMESWRLYRLTHRRVAPCLMMLEKMELVAKSGRSSTQRPLWGITRAGRSYLTIDNTGGA